MDKYSEDVIACAGLAIFYQDTVGCTLEQSDIYTYVVKNMGTLYTQQVLECIDLMRTWLLLEGWEFKNNKRLGHKISMFMRIMNELCPSYDWSKNNEIDIQNVRHIIAAREAKHATI